MDQFKTIYYIYANDLLKEDIQEYFDRAVEFIDKVIKENPGTNMFFCGEDIPFYISMYDYFYGIHVREEKYDNSYRYEILIISSKDLFVYAGQKLDDLCCEEDLEYRYEYRVVP